MINEEYRNPYSNYPYISHVRSQSPAAIMRRIHTSKSNDQKHNPIALEMAIIEEKIERLLAQ